jgi:hypothetical protein
VVPDPPATLDRVWYTQVSPTATGNGIEVPAAETGIGVELARLCDRTPLPSAVLSSALLPGAVLPDAVAMEVREELFPDRTLGNVLVGVPHPARAITAALTKTTLIDPCLLMQLPLFRNPRSTTVRSGVLQVTAKRRREIEFRPNGRE